MSKKKRRDIPRFANPIFETHCHLDYLDPEELAQALESARAVGVDRIVTIAVSADNLDTVIALAESAPDIWTTQGIYPHEAAGCDAQVLARVRGNASHERVVAIGEIGLDYHYDHCERQQQRIVFEQQLELAAELDLPVVIHTREADADTRAIIDNCAGNLHRKGVIHSFTSSPELAEYCLAQGFHLGFNGIVTFNRADNVRDVVALTPVDKILLETDAPYLTPVPYRGRPNSPCYLPFIAETVAEIKAISPEQLLSITYENSSRLFFGNG